jgi:hypothetical protein
MYDTLINANQQTACLAFVLFMCTPTARVLAKLKIKCVID